jgi:hypothetical protein
VYPAKEKEKVVEEGGGGLEEMREIGRDGMWMWMWLERIGGFVLGERGWFFGGGG